MKNLNEMKKKHWKLILSALKFVIIMRDFVKISYSANVAEGSEM